MTAACLTASSGYYDPVRHGETSLSVTAHAPPVTTASCDGKAGVRLSLTAGQTHDEQVVDRLLDHLGPRTIVLAGKAYDADRIRDLIQDQGATPNIPPKRNRKWMPCFSKQLYRERNLIERFFSKLKHFRRVATCYDKLAANFLAMVQLASMRLWLRAHESMA